MSKLIFFEGIDKSGKSTLRRNFELQNNYQYVCHDRSILSQLVYNKVYKREHDNDILYKISKDICKHSVIVLCIVNANDFLERIESTDEMKCHTISRRSLFYQQTIFIDIVNKLKANFIEINTSANNIDACVNKLQNFMEICDDMNDVINNDLDDDSWYSRGAYPDDD